MGGPYPAKEVKVQDPLEARKVRFETVGLLNLHQSRGAVGHALADILLFTLLITLEPRVE